MPPTTFGTGGKAHAILLRKSQQGREGGKLIVIIS